MANDPPGEGGSRLDDERGREASDAEDATSRPPSTLDRDELFEALAHYRRRYVLHALDTQSDRTLEAVATTVAEWEADRERGSNGEWQPVYVSLSHSHVPKLVAEDVVRYDADTERVAPGPQAPEAFAALEGIDDALQAADD